MRRPSSFRRILAVAAALAAASCRPEAAPPSAGAPLCRTATSLPGSEPLPADVLSALVITFVPPEAPGTGSRVCNRLALEPAALARRRAVDPVDWRPWSGAALSEAARRKRPVLALTGLAASAASWDFAADVLADPKFAADTNRAFVPVLVDRDERPDVDAFLMEAVAVMTGGGGWPAVVFLDADGKPFEACSWGASAGDCGPLKPLVERVARRLTLGGGSFGVRADLTDEKLQRRASIDPSGPLPDAKAVSDALRGYLASSFDAASATFGGPPLFPRAPALRFLLGRRDDPASVAMAAAALEAMRASELRDAKDGGYFRYASAAGWRQPSREKMLADNAALASAFLDAAEATGREGFREEARGILDFLRAKLALPGGAFALALAEGGRRDDRAAADANAVAISALLQGARVLGEASYRDSAVAAATEVDSRLREEGRVLHLLHADGRRSGTGYLADSTLFALACLDLDAAGAAGGSRWLDAATALAADLLRRFEHEGTGGFFQAPSDAEALPLRLKPSLDAAVPSGNSAAALLFTRLFARTGDARFDATARRTFEAFSETLTLKPTALPAMAAALEEWSRLPRQASAPPQLDPAPAVHP